MRVHAVLTLKVVYDDANSIKQIKDVLDAAVEHLADNGLLSDESEMLVDEWEHKIECRPVKQ